MCFVLSGENEQQLQKADLIVSATFVCGWDLNVSQISKRAW